jgi:hypothetical protein
VDIRQKYVRNFDVSAHTHVVNGELLNAVVYLLLREVGNRLLILTTWHVSTIYNNRKVPGSSGYFLVCMINAIRSSLGASDSVV